MENILSGSSKRLQVLLWFEIVFSMFLCLLMFFVMFISLYILVSYRNSSSLIFLGISIAYIWLWCTREVFILRNKKRYKVITTENYDPRYFEAKGFKLFEKKIPFSWFKYYEVYIDNISFIVYPTSIGIPPYTVSVTIHFIPKNINEEELKKLLQLIPA